jgi:hypothetical protein
LSDLEEKLSTIMIDPSVLTSAIHIQKLFDIKQKLFVPATLTRAIEDEKIEEVLRYFVWPYFRLPKFSPEYFELTEKIRPSSYKHREENVKEIIPLIERANLPEHVRLILLEEYSFLKEHSALLLRFRRTVQHFRIAGVATLDAANKLKDKKEKIFEQIRGPRWIVAVLLGLGGVDECLTGDPLLGTILAVSGFILTVFDP